MDPTTGVVKVGRLDGNALAGLMGELFTGDITLATGECGSCGSSAVLATAVVELDDAGAIVLCPSCRRTLFSIVGGTLRIEHLRALTL
jgi:predicted aconitase with swiveling domain